MRKSYIPRVAAKDRHRLGSFKYYIRGRKVTVRSLGKPARQDPERNNNEDDQEEEKEDGMLTDE